jgi:GT2 family glycosyltransferase
MDSNSIDTEIRITCLMTSYNRCENTINAIDKYYSSVVEYPHEKKLILVDDGSTDGTSEMVSELHPDVKIIHGDGSLFWNRGMHIAQSVAMDQNIDYLLWLNDDTELFVDSLQRMIEVERRLCRELGSNVIIVGSTKDRNSGKLTYGGYTSISRLKPFTYERVWHETEPKECHVMNGNIVLIPIAIARDVGNLDYTFEHAMGDTDYSLRARNLKYNIFVAPGYVGFCSNNPVINTYKDCRLELSKKWKLIRDRKGLPIKSWLHFTRSHGGMFWPVYFFWPYVKLIATHPFVKK